MKKKICALILCICMCFTVFAGCSLWRKQETLTADTVIAKVYNKDITYADLQSKYQQYNQYFAYYDEDVVMKIIYEEMYLNAMQEYWAERTVKLSEEDLDEIFEDLYHNFVHVINSYEKTFIENDGKTAPSRLTDEEKDPTKFEEYEFEPAKPIDFESVTEAQAPDFDEKLVELKDEVFAGVEPEFMEYRLKAWDKYASNLVYNYKLQGKTYSANDAVLETMKTLYNSLHKTKMTERYREYVEGQVFGNKTYDEQIADVAIQEALVAKYKELLNESKQNNTVEDNYTKTVFSTSATDLILYHYNGEYTFFTVQHLLVKFTDDQVNELKTYEGYDKNKDQMFRDEYVAARLSMAFKDNKWVLSTSYRDKDGVTVMVKKEDATIEGADKTVYEKDENGDFVMVPKTDDTIEGEDKTVYKKDSTTGEFLRDENGLKIPELEKKAVMVEAKITLQDIKVKYDADLTTAMNEYLAQRREETGNSAYELTDGEKSYVANKLFKQYVYMYTGDTGALGSGKLIDELGYAVSTDPDNDAGLMSEFADTARALYADYEAGGKYIGETVNFAVTDYGVHMMILSGVYSKGEIYSFEDKTREDFATEEEYKAYLTGVIDGMNDIKISSSSTQTLLEYVYTKLKAQKLESFYSTKLYELLDSAKASGEFKVLKEPTYHDLSGR